MGSLDSFWLNHYSKNKQLKGMFGVQIKKWKTKRASLGIILVFLFFSFFSYTLVRDHMNIDVELAFEKIYAIHCSYMHSLLKHKIFAHRNIKDFTNNLKKKKKKKGFIIDIFWFTSYSSKTQDKHHTSFKIKRAIIVFIIQSPFHLCDHPTCWQHPYFIITMAWQKKSEPYIYIYI